MEERARGGQIQAVSALPAAAGFPLTHPGGNAMNARCALVAGSLVCMLGNAHAFEERNWSRVWGAYSNDQGRAVAVDAATNVYVAGSTYGGFHSQTNPGVRCATLTSWTEAGCLRWTQLWGPAGSHAEAHGVAGDGLGHVYVAGLTWGPIEGIPAVGNGDFFLAKYTDKGERLWLRIWGSTGFDQANAVAVCHGTNIYVAGSARGSVYGQPHVNLDDFCLSRFDAEGNHVWTRMWGAVNAKVLYEGATAVATDSGGHAYVAGFSDASVDGQAFAGSFDAVLTRFRADGTKDWTRMWGAGGLQKAQGVAVDGADRIYVAGLGGPFNGQSGVGAADPFLMQVATNGAAQWTRLWGSVNEDMGLAVACDTANRIHVTGLAAYGRSFDGQGGYDGGAFLTRFLADGTRVFTKRWGAGDTEGHGVACVGADLAFVGGWTYGGMDGQPMVGNEDHWISRWGPYGPPRLTTAPWAMSVLPGTANVQWETSSPTDSAVDYSRYATGWEGTAFAAPRVQTHDLTITGLVGGATYRYRVRSTDDDGRAVTSGVAFVTIKGAGGFAALDSTLVADGRGLLDFIADSSGDVDRVSFSVNGLVVGTHYGDRARWRFAPGNGLCAAGENRFAAAGFRSDGTMAAMDIGTWMLNDTGLPTRLEIELPWPGTEIYTDTDIAPATNLLLRVEAARQVTTLLGEGGIEIQPGVPGEGFRVDWAGVTNVEFRIDGHTVHTSHAALPDQPLHHEYRYDVTGLSTGIHRFTAILRAPPGYRQSVESRTFRVERRRPEITAWREIAYNASSNGFIVTLGIRNRGSAPAQLWRIDEQVTGFHVCRIATPWPTNDVRINIGSSYPERVSSFTVRTQGVHTVTIPADGTVRIVYHAVPILFQGGCDYRIGGAGRFRGQAAGSAGLDVPLLDEPTLVGSFPHFDPFDEAVTRAIGSSDYLMLTAPSILKGLYGGSYQRILAKLAELATYRGAVLAYYHPVSIVSTDYAVGDLLAKGMVFDPNAGFDQVCIGDQSANRIRPYTRAVEMTSEPMPLDLDLRPGDALAVGNVLPWDVTGTNPHPHAEIVVGWSGAHEWDDGKLHILKDCHHPDTNVITTVVVERSDYTAGGALLTAHTTTSTNGVELLVFEPDGVVRFGRMHDTGDYFVNRWIGTDFRSNDLVAAGDILDDALDEVVVGSLREDRVIVYSHGTDSSAAPAYAEELGLDLALDAGDALAVGDVRDDFRKEIVIADASANALYVYQWDGWRLQLVETVPWRFDAGDGLLLAHHGALDKDQILIVRGSAHDDTPAGTLETLRLGAGELPGDRYALDALLNEGGEWAAQLAPDWTHDGHLLIVGESEVIPTFSVTWRVYYNARHEYWTVDFTDREYADTREEMDLPELAVGRIVGNTANDVIAPLQASIDIAAGLVPFRNGSALGVAGNEDGMRFRHVRRSVCGTLGDKGFAVTQMSNDGSQAVFGAALDRDVIFLAGHGNWRNWDGLNTENMRTNFTVGATHPLVYAMSCLTGRYPPGYGWAEAWLRQGASLYMGAMNNVYSYGDYGRGWGPRFAEAFTGRLQTDYTIGQSLKHAKRYRLSGDANTYGHDWNLNRYHCATHHLYGDPKLAFAWDGAGGMAVPAHAAPPLERSVLAGPQPTLAITVPPFAVEHTNGEDYVWIEGQDELIVEGCPVVPLYTVALPFPSNCCVRGVTLRERGGESAPQGLKLVPAVLDSNNVGRTVAADPQPGAGWWPTNTFAWSLEEHGTTGATLRVTVYPFYHNADTGESRCFTNYLFDIDYIHADLTVWGVELDRPVHTNGALLAATVWLYATSPEARDVTLAPELVCEANGAVIPLPLRVLRGLSGWASARLSWPLPRLAAGAYRLRVTALDANGGALDRAHAMLTVGAVGARLHDLALTPDGFKDGEPVTLQVTLDNAGDTALDGALYFVVEDGAGQTVATFTHAIEALAAGSGKTYTSVWAPATLHARNCRVLAYAVYGGQTATLQIAADGSLAPLALDTIRTDSGGCMISWLSVAGRRYRLERAADLEQGFAPLPGEWPATPPRNEATDPSAPARAFYRLIESTGE